MASKLDNLRKLHADNMLTEEEMDSVAGGLVEECADDSRFLNVLLRGHPAQPDRYGEYKFNFNYSENPNRFRELQTAWSACGVEVRMTTDLCHNRYEIMETGRVVDRSEAMEYAMKKMGRRLQHSDWYW